MCRLGSLWFSWLALTPQHAPRDIKLPRKAGRDPRDGSGRRHALTAHDELLHLAEVFALHVVAQCDRGWVVHPARDPKRDAERLAERSGEGVHFVGGHEARVPVVAEEAFVLEDVSRWVLTLAILTLLPTTAFAPRGPLVPAAAAHRSDGREGRAIDVEQEG